MIPVNTTLCILWITEVYCAPEISAGMIRTFGQTFPVQLFDVLVFLKWGLGKRLCNTPPRNRLDSVKCSLCLKSTFRNREVLLALRGPSVQWALHLVRHISGRPGKKASLTRSKPKTPRWERETDALPYTAAPPYKSGSCWKAECPCVFCR